jgi:hypothetical protein
MNMMNGLRLAGALATAALLGGCGPQVSSLSCDDMVAKAKEGTASGAVRITDVRNVSEESRTDAEARCRGEAVLSNNETSPVYLRAYKEESSGNVMVQWSPDPIAADAPAP